MTPIPSPVSQVSIYPYIPDAPIVVPPVFIEGSGTYSVGTLATSIFYNLDLTSGMPKFGGVHAGSKYYAICKDAAGKEMQTTWLTCLKGGDNPQFGRTSTLGQRPVEADAADSLDTSNSADLVYQVHLKDIEVNMYVAPTEPLLIQLIVGGKGIATFGGRMPFGTWKVDVTGGERVNPLHVGMGVTISGTNVATGRALFIPATLITRNAGTIAEFVQAR